MGAVVDVIEDVGDFITDEIVEPVFDVVENVVENPAALAGLALSVAAPGIGTAIGSALGASGAAATAIGNAVIGGTLSEASGGDFVQGALTSGAGSLLGGVVNPAVTESVGSQAIGQALTGGAMAELQGGDFLQGALTGAASGAINDAKLAAAEDYLQSIPTGTDYETNIPTQTELEQWAGVEPSTPSVSDYPVQDFGVPVSTDSGFYSSPEATGYVQNQDGTSTYTWDDGSSITVDQNSNLVGYTPTSDILSAPSQQEAATKDISGKLAALDVAKALTPAAITALIAANATSSEPEQITGFGIVPIPADWKSPAYNQQFTPSAPIDFGSPELLKGTQWESPLDISQVINTINSQSFQQQPMVLPDFMSTFQGAPTVGTADIIGELGGKPVSIADIVAGIQSGQTYPSAMG